MNRATLDRIADAVLYEGYLLYPYRRSSVKNQQRWSFGALAPKLRAGGGRSWSTQTEVLVRGPATTRVETSTRFLQLCERRDASGDAPWHEAEDHEVAAPDATLAELAAAPCTHEFALPGGEARDADFVRRRVALAGRIGRSAEQLRDDVWRVRVRVENLSTCADATGDAEAELWGLASLHVLLGVAGGAFESALDPDAGLAELAAGCKNLGLWPVLAGAPGARDTMLAAPIILYDYPCVAPESPGDLFDGTEIDEILTLRILTMSEDEKREARAVDERARRLIDRTLALGEDELRRLHGRLAQRVLRPGARVRLAPRGRRDIFDLALAGRTGEIASLEQDYEGRVLVTVLVDDDPGRDLGAEGKPGHRFFFHPEEVELL